MLTEQLSIYRDTFRTCVTLMKYQTGGVPKGDVPHPKMPKCITNGAFQQCVDKMLEALDKTYIANSKESSRYEVLQDYLCLVGAVRSRIRMLGELRYLTDKQQTNLMFMLDSCGKQATAWRNTARATR